MSFDPPPPPWYPPTTPEHQLPPPPAPRRHTAAVLGALAGCMVVGAGIAAFVLTRGPSSTGTPAGGGGSVVYRDPHGLYTVTFSGQPVYHDTVQSTPSGDVPYRYAEYTAPGVDQTIGVLILPEGTGFDLSKGLQGAASGVGGTVVSSAQGTFQGYQSIFGVVSLSSGFLDTEVVNAGSDIYIFGTLGSSNPPPDFHAFVGSVHLTPQ